MIFPPCINTYDYTLPVCNDFPCYLNDSILGIWDSIMNNILPTIFISIFSVAILIRVYYQKRRVNQVNRWRTQRKMTIQLLSNSVLYLIPNIPLNILNFAHLCGLSKTTGVQTELYFDFLCYFVILLFPFVCLGYLFKLYKKAQWKQLLSLRQPQQVAVIALQ